MYEKDAELTIMVFRPDQQATKFSATSEEIHIFDFQVISSVDVKATKTGITLAAKKVNELNKLM